MKTYLATLFLWILFLPVFCSAVEIRSGVLNESEIWNLADSPYKVQGELKIPPGVELIIQAGVEIRMLGDSFIRIHGKLHGLGEADNPISFVADEDLRWKGLLFEEKSSGRLQHCQLDHGSHFGGNRNGMITAYRCAGSVIIDSCTFTDWPGNFDSKATQAYFSPLMEIRHCYFGPGANEAVHGYASPVLVEHCIFDRRFGYSDAIDLAGVQLPLPRPAIRYNRFLGSIDDAIDLDAYDAWVEGNWVMNCRGGSNDPIGISGDQESKPVLINNVIYNCETGIGFKNGADITVINNTIVNCDRGIWLHQEPASATVINTIIWGENQNASIRLEPGSTIDVSYSIVEGENVYPGEMNQNRNPQFAGIHDLNFTLLPGSPAIDAGLSSDLESLPQLDFRGKARTHTIDIGAFEYQLQPNVIMDWWRH